MDISRIRDAIEGFLMLPLKCSMLCVLTRAMLKLEHLIEKVETVMLTSLLRYCWAGKAFYYTFSCFVAVFMTDLQCASIICNLEAVQTQIVVSFFHKIRGKIFFALRHLLCLCADGNFANRMPYSDTVDVLFCCAKLATCLDDAPLLSVVA